MATVDDVAEWLLQRAAVEGERLSMSKLQSLIYYAQGWSLAVTGEALFEDDILAGLDGPYVPAVAEKFADHPLLAENTRSGTGSCNPATAPAYSPTCTAERGQAHDPTPMETTDA